MMRSVKVLAIGLCVFAMLVLVASNLGGFLFRNQESVLAFSRGTQHFSVELMGLRLALYSLICWQWPQWLKHLKIPVRTDLVPRLRWFVLEMCVAYELVFGLNIFQWLKAGS